MASSLGYHVAAIAATVVVTVVVVAAPVGLCAWAIRQLRQLRKGR